MGDEGPRVSRWFRGDDCATAPTKADLAAIDAGSRQVLQGWAPETPPIDRTTKIVAFGSCFAANIANWLEARNYALLTAKGGDNAGVHIVSHGEGMVNTFVLRQQFEWALDGRRFSDELWHGRDAKALGYDEATRLKTREIFLAADLFIITLGLSEIWCDEVTGDVFWRAVPRRRYDPARHRFRVSTVAENRANIIAMADIIRRHRPGAKVIFTLSPIPLQATFRPVSCMTANSVSKAILRAALDEALREIARPDEVFYWPSYELTTELFDDCWQPDRRHIRPPILDYVMTLFEETWCADGAPSPGAAERYVAAAAAARDLPRLTPRALAGAWTPALTAIVLKRLAYARPDQARLIVEAAAVVAERLKPGPARRLARWSARWRRRLEWLQARRLRRAGMAD